MIYSSFFIVKNQFTDIGDSTYVNQVRVDDYEPTAQPPNLNNFNF